MPGPTVTPIGHVVGSTTVSIIVLFVVQVVFTYGGVVPALFTHAAGSEKVVALLAPAGLRQALVIQDGAVPAVVPGGPHPAAVVKMVWY